MRVVKLTSHVEFVLQLRNFNSVPTEVILQYFKGNSLVGSAVHGQPQLTRLACANLSHKSKNSKVCPASSRHVFSGLRHVGE